MDTNMCMPPSISTYITQMTECSRQNSIERAHGNHHLESNTQQIFSPYEYETSMGETTQKSSYLLFENVETK